MKATNGIALLFAVCALLLAIGCSEKSEPPEQHAVPGPTADSQNLPSTSKPPSDVEKFRALLANPDRSAEDQARDAGRKPAEVLEFLQIGPAMTVIDLIAAGGYYTEVLSLRVGSEGRVYAQNPALVLKFRDGANDKAMTARLADDRLKNVIRWDHEFDDLGIEPNSVDAAITALNFHDVYNNNGPEGAQGVLAAVKNILKPGGVLGIIDHVGVAGADNKKLHRIDPQVVREEAEKAGFVIDGASDLLSTPEDAHDQFVFAEGLRGKTDRFLLRLRKPAV